MGGDILSKARILFTLVILASLLLAGCPASPRPPKDKGGDRVKPPGRATPAIQVAAPTVQLVENGKIAPASPAIHVFLWGNPDTTERDLRLAKEAGFTWVKQRFEWRYIEKTKNNANEWGEPDRITDAVNKAGLGMVVRLDNQPEWARKDKIFPRSGPPDKMEDWKDYVEDVSERYKGKIAAYEIWNEPNLSREWGGAKPDPKAYTEMLRLSYIAIKKNDPNALVISAGMSPTTEISDRAMPDVQFIEEMYAAGAGQYFDLLGVHAAGYKAAPEEDPGTVALDPVKTNNDPSSVSLKRSYSFRHVEDLRAIMVKNGEESKQIAIMEMGWSADPRPNSPYYWHSVTEDQKGEYLVRGLQYAKQNWSPWVAMLSMIYLPSPTWTASDEQYYWSITNPDGTLRPAYNALKQAVGGRQ